MIRLSDDDMREVFNAQLVIVNTESSRLREMPLPSFWDDPHCCDNQTLQVVEPGYDRWEEVDEIILAGEISDRDEHPGPWMHGVTDGWDSMSEHGTLEYLECNPHNGGCGKIWAMPEQFDWD